MNPVRATLHRFDVYDYSPGLDVWEHNGQVLLPDHASTAQIRHALLVLGLYAPRGSDVVAWDVCAHCGSPAADINGEDGVPLVRLEAV